MKLQALVFGCCLLWGALAWVPPPLPSSRSSRSRLFSASDEDDESREARLLLEKAQKARREADSMERDLVSSKLKVLEGLLKERGSRLSTADEKDVQDRIDRLKNYDKAGRQPPPKKEEEKEEEKQAEEKEETPSLLSSLFSDSDTPEEDREIVPELTPEDKQALEQVQDIVLFFKDILNATEEIDADPFQELNELESELSDLVAGNITQEELEGVKTVTQVVTGMADFLGIKNASMWSELKQEIVEGSRELNEELSKDPLYMERLEDLGKYVPPQILEARDVNHRLNDTDMEEFVQKVMLPLGGDVFPLASIHPQKMARAYLLPGKQTTPTLAISGDDLVDRIDRQLEQVGLQDKFQFYYLRDVTEIVDLNEAQLADQLQATDEAGQVDLGDLMERVGNLAKPALLVTSAQVDLAPLTQPNVRAPWSLLAVVSTAAFALDCYPEEFNLVQQLQVGFTSPIFLGILAIQLLHELGHLAAAALNKIEIAYPFTMIPSPSTGLLHTNTQLKSPPKNNNALFDFAIMGPILGLAASWTALLVGLQLTAGVRSAEIASLPHLPLEFFQLSTLTSATIETVLGTDVLLSMDSLSETGVAVHPLVVAGHVGILLNALNLLPTMGTTDGGRMLTAVHGRTSIVAEFLPPLCGLFLFVQGFRGWETCPILLLYYFVLGGLSQHKVELPCRNDVDPAGGIRLPASVATTLLAVIALSPAFS